MTTRQCRSHNPLYQVLDLGVTPEVVSVISHRASTVLPYQTAAPVSPRSNAVGGNFDSPSPELVADRPTPPGSRSSGIAVKVPPMQDFISRLAVASRVNIGTLVSTLVYLDRLKHNMPSHATAMECTNHRIFLASLILAGKYLNDASPKNKYWARFSERFSLAEVNLMEQQLMQLLQFQFEITEAQLLAQLSSFAHLITPPASPVTYTIRPRGVVGGNHDHLPPPSAVAMHPRRGSGGTSSLVSITPSRTPSSTLLTAESMSSTIAPSPLELNCTSLAHPAPIHHQYHSSAPAAAVQTQPQPPHYQFTHVAQPGTAAIAETQPSAAAQRGGPHPPSYYQSHPPPVALPHFSAVFNHPPSISQPELLTHPAQHIYHHSSAPAHHQYHHHTQQQRSMPYPAPSAAHLMPMHVPHNHHRQQHHPASASAAAMHPTPHCSTSDAAAAFYLYHQWTSAGAAPGSVSAVVSNLSARTQQPPPPHMSYAPTAYSNTEAAGNLTYRPSACIVYQN